LIFFQNKIQKKFQSELTNPKSKGKKLVPKKKKKNINFFSKKKPRKSFKVSLQNLPIRNLLKKTKI
jgi:hypothetical protein